MESPPPRSTRPASGRWLFHLPTAHSHWPPKRTPARHSPAQRCARLQRRAPTTVAQMTAHRKAPRQHSSLLKSAHLPADLEHRFPIHIPARSARRSRRFGSRPSRQASPIGNCRPIRHSGCTRSRSQPFQFQHQHWQTLPLRFRSSSAHLRSEYPSAPEFRSTSPPSSRRTPSIPRKSHPPSPHELQSFPSNSAG